MLGLLASLGSGLASLFGGKKTMGQALLGSLLGGFASNQQFRGWDEGTQTTTTDMLREAVEPEYFSAFRRGLVDRFMRELEQTAVPSLEAQRASILSESGKMAEEAVRATREALARMGRMDSGSADVLTSNIFSQMAQQRAQRLTDLPFQMAQQRMGLMLPMFQLGAGWAGQAPISLKQTGTETTTSRRRYEQSGGTPFWRSALGGLGGAIGARMFL